MAATVKCDTVVNASSATNNLALDTSGNVTVGNNLTVTGTTTQTGAQTFSSNVTMSGSGARFLGDFTNATVTNRVSFQTSTANSTTGIYALPSGTGTAASWQATNAADPTNASKILIATNGSTDVQLVSGRNGTGTYLPLSFYTNNTQNAQLDTSGNLTTVGTVNMGSSFLRNRIINGAMQIDQRNAGASITPNSQYTLDRWYFTNSQTGKFTLQQNAGSVTTAAGFPNYLGLTSTSAYSVAAGDYFLIAQFIEGFNFADLAFGTSSAKTVTLSFQVYSSLTGTFGGSIANFANTRSYVFSYTISSANTWTQISVTIPGDTGGTWVGATNAGAAQVRFGLGVGSTYSTTAGSWAATNYVSATGATSVVGTNGATFYITGVQLEVGSVATPFERRQYGQELALCQRYLPMWRSPATGYIALAPGYCYSTTQASIIFPLPVQARVPPTGITISSGTDFAVQSATTQITTNVTFGIATNMSAGVDATVASGLTNGQGARLATNNTTSAYIYFTGCEL